MTFWTVAKAEKGKVRMGKGRSGFVGHMLHLIISFSCAVFNVPQKGWGPSTLYGVMHGQGKVKGGEIIVRFSKDVQGARRVSQGYNRETI